MKIVTVTSQKAYNYGAVLQAYALQQTLLDCGYENEILDYSNKVDFKKKYKSIKVIIRDVLLFALKILHYRQYKRFCNNFKTFLKEKLVLTDNYSSVEKIMENPPKADCYLTGSDQVFALTNKMVPIRFLDFGSDKISRVSYAASLGSYNMNQEELDYMAQRLKCFSKISIREKQGSEYLQKAVGIDCHCNIDPVFLLTPEKWGELIPDKNRIKGEYILCFPMLNNKNLQPTINELKKRTGLPVISVQTKFYKTVKADKYLYDVSVPEFLSLIKNASAVITTSFHITAFSVIFKRPLYSLVGKYKPERVQNLCELLGLQERVIAENTDILPPLDIDYSGVDTIIEKERKKGIEYIKSFKDLQ